METSRFFVANLPVKVTESDLRQLFQDYGHVQRVELKTKENLLEPEQAKVLAFVTVEIGAEDAQYCLNELQWQKLHGASLKVSLAKESFLDRLKREREAAQQTATAPSQQVVSYEEDEQQQQPSSLLLQQQNTRKRFAEDAGTDDEEIDPSLLITKKRAASSMHNGKIVIQSYDSTPLHVIESKKHASKKLDGKASSADDKRKQSLKNMKNQYQEKKSAIQQALLSLDKNKSNKIIFSDAEEDEEDRTVLAEQHTSKSQTNIFGSDDEADDAAADFALKPEYFGKKGEKLMQLQSKQSLDPRFRIDAKFVQDEEDDDENYDNDILQQNNEPNERDWQMGILEQVIGSKLDTRSPAGKTSGKQKPKQMIRYDPSKEADESLLKTAENSETRKNKKQKTNSAEQETEQPNNKETPAVSKEVFYMVTDTLSQSLKTRGDGFSLLNMFGKSNEELEQREDQLKKIENGKILLNRADKNALSNPFSYDSSSDEENNEQTQPNDESSKSRDAATAKGKQKVKILMETFFIPKNDARLKEGAKFFQFDKEISNEDYEEVRNRLKVLIKTKINKTKKNLPKQGKKLAHRAKK